MAQGVHPMDTVEDATEILPNLWLGNVRASVDDNLEEDEIRNMELWSAEITFKMMAEYMSGKPILVHCMAGMQRSAASMAMMLIAYKRIHAQEAMKMIKDRRSIAFHPGANFGRSIQYFDRLFHSEILPHMKQLQSTKKE